MKILVAGGAGSQQFVRLGYVNAFNKLGNQAVGWYPFDKPAFDVFNEFEPDLFLLGASELDKAIYKCIKMRPKLKLVVWAESNINMQNLFEFSKRTLVVAPTITNHLDVYSEWVKDFKVIPLLPAADSFTNYVTPDKYSEGFACDVAYMGLYDQEKREKIDKYILQVATIFKTKIFGLGDWPVPQHLGYLPNELVSLLYHSAKVSLVLSREAPPHHVSENIFKILVSGGNCVAEYTAAADTVFGSRVKFFKKPEDVCIAVASALDKKERHDKWIMENHTYLNRVETLTKNL